MTATTFPLQWPEGWPRTVNRRRRYYKVTIEAAYEHLISQLRLLGAMRGSIVVSSNVPPRNGLGTPRNDGATVADPGVAAYWTLTRVYGRSEALGPDRVVACDRWDSVRDNVRAIGLALEGMRAMERAGASQILDRAFQAFGALPASSEAPVVRPWWEVLGFPEGMISHLSLAVIDARYRELAPRAHPDHGGSSGEFSELTRAREQARAHYGASRG